VDLTTPPHGTAGTPEAQAWERLGRHLVEDVWHKYGPFAALLIVVLVIFIAAAFWLVRQLLLAKDQEIERLVAERNRLQEAVLAHRSSTNKKK